MPESQPSVFLLEDDPIILLELARDLEELGWRTTDSCDSITEAMRRARTVEADLAILDINIKGLPSYPIAKIFRRRGIPLIFTTGYIGERAASYPNAVILSKPYSFLGLQNTIRQALVSSPVTLSTRAGTDCFI